MRRNNALTRSLIGSLALVASLSLSKDTRAQEDDETIPVEEPGPPGDSVDEGTAGSGEPGSKASKGKGGKNIDANAPQVSETHAVQSGDTLWDLCSKYLNSP